MNNQKNSEVKIRLLHTPHPTFFMAIFSCRHKATNGHLTVHVHEEVEHVNNNHNRNQNKNHNHNHI